MKKPDAIADVAWFILGIAVMVNSLGLKLGTLRSPGSGLMPFVIGALLAIVAVARFADAVRTPHRGAAGGGMRLVDLRNPALIAGAMFAFPLILEPLGFMVTTFLFLLVLLKGLEPRSWPRALASSAVVAVLAYAVFVRLLDVELPAGRWLSVFTPV
jgi:putative tricarboxylic transport membrane protein